MRHLSLDKQGTQDQTRSILTNTGDLEMPDYIYNLYEAKTRLSNPVDRAAKGEEINKLNLVLHEKLNIVRLDKLTKAREVGQAHMKNWPNPLMP